MNKAYVLINCELNKKKKVIENLKHIDSVKEVQGTFGAYDVIVKIEHEQKDNVRETVKWNIRKMDDVRSTLTLVDTGQQN
ncbi:Lrp/AsnC ligand binding domain-containing protein [Nitrosopumilus sp.]|uniref:Lrp/AsnC ligand binding domain-containing protein n=1 Tax=Nitrosopumilus sp. TaxID=2024843 RepID=UPI00247DFD86|nr:Lrp/AsnC ligand binding domain-containing protein [Nitrosopumilus sp.]MCV0409257.1 Lrp/AsnC ligand binding domain-containing protein [Nitrosopumilus sp.]